MSDIIKIIIVEDNAIFREGLKKVLQEIRNVEVIGEASNGTEFIELLKKSKPDIVFMDIKMPGMNGMEATDLALKQFPDLKIIVLTMFGEDEYLYTMVLKGIKGFLLKTVSKVNLEQSIKMVHAGQEYYSPELNGLLASKFRQLASNEIPRFTKKETEVLRLICKGFSTEEIAGMLYISKRTVEGYRAKLLMKTGMNNSINLVIYVLRHRLLSLVDFESKE